MTELLYTIPPKFQSLFDQGKVEISGAMLRWVDKKGIAAHMVPMSKSASEKMAQTLANLPGGIASLTPALQVINLGVNVVGFAYMAVKLESISRQISALDNHIMNIASDVQTIRQINETSMTTELVAGMEEAERGERLCDFEMLNAARRDLNRGFLHHLSMIPAMIREGNAAIQLPSVEKHVQRAVLLATAVARCDWLAQGPQAATDWLKQADKRLRGVLNDLQVSYRHEHDFLKHLVEDEAPIKAFFERSRGLLEVLGSHVAQMSHAEHLALRAPVDWDAYLKEQSKTGDVLFLAPCLTPED